MKQTPSYRIFLVQLCVRQGIAMLEEPLQNGKTNITPEQGWTTLKVFDQNYNSDDESNAEDCKCSLRDATKCYEYHKLNTLRLLIDMGGKGELRVVAFDFNEIMLSTTKGCGIDIFS